MPELSLELPLQSAQSSAAWVGTQDGGGKMNIDIFNYGWVLTQKQIHLWFLFTNIVIMGEFLYIIFTHTQI